MQFYGKETDLLSRLGETPENFTGKILVISMFSDISCGTKNNERECLANAEVVSTHAKLFRTGQWSFIGPGSAKKWSSMKKTAHKEFGIISRKRCWWNSQRMDVQFSVLRLHCPGVNSKAKDTENCRFTLLPTKRQLRLVFA